jgi:hypothetical protein
MEQQNFSEDRRDFLAKAFSLAALACLGCKGAAAQKLLQEPTGKTSGNLGLNAEETYQFFYDMFIPLFNSLADEMGREKFLSILTDTSSKGIEQMVASMTKDMESHNLKAFGAFMKDILSSPPYNSAFIAEVVKDTEDTFELKYTDCLPARLLKAMGASDIGLAIECSGAKAAAKGFNPKIKATNPKNIFRGDDYCIERFTMET